MQQPLFKLAARPLVGLFREANISANIRHIFRPSTGLPYPKSKCRPTHTIRHFAGDSKPPASQSQPPNPPHASIRSTDDAFSASNLPSVTEHRRSLASKRLSQLMDNLQGNIFIASQRLNDLTGYSGIEALKESISRMETELNECQEAVRAARQQYKQTVADRASSQREVTTLLSRKDTWSAADLERFTSLYRSDHSNEQAVQEAATKLADMERVAEQTAAKLSSSILARYHEEQIWSDKIRRMSTWGTWGLMGVNILLFFVFQFGFEPWRRARLVKGFEDKVREALQKEKDATGVLELDRGLDIAKTDGIIVAGIEELEDEADSAQIQQPVVDALAAAIKSKETSVIDRGGIEGVGFSWHQPQTWKTSILRLFGEQSVSMKQQQITLVALEGFTTGVALAGLVTIFIMRPH